MANRQAELIRNGDFFISSNKNYLDIDVIHHFLSEESYWLKGISKELVIAAIEHSILCYGVYEGDPTTGSPKQIGFARVVSDLVRFSWLGDVFILPEYRGKGLSKWLMSVITEHPHLKGTNFHLATRDAHSLYTQYGFKPLDNIENRMARPFDWDAIYDGYKEG
ncbi:GNAT family N-acetyltransferase [Cytobacillus solani]|uniref:GNAT family N-acetyltransferase n=1 Tax=Cytobacillus solani TaxID=1637975 RepID=UPI001E39A023|nr:GNAT family N-acetyltransferase [Cytobacillus solani]